MFRSDARESLQNTFSKMNTITIEVMFEIQKDIEPNDMVSLVFLLYDIPHTALQRLVVYQRVCADIGSKSSNLLTDWAAHAQTHPYWREEFVEALAICQLYSVIKKLGLNIPSIKKHFLPDDLSFTHCISQTKKVLYKLCDNMSEVDLDQLKRTLDTYEVDTSEYKLCELVLLELMSRSDFKIEGKFDAAKLGRIIGNMPALKLYADELKGEKSNDNSASVIETLSEEIPMNANVGLKLPQVDFDEMYKMIGEMKLEDIDHMNLKSDNSKFNADAYPIINKERIGICVIINEETFYESKETIEKNMRPLHLEKRCGSTKDKEIVQATMKSLNFEVICYKNIDHKNMMKNIENILRFRVYKEDSMFILCILSHGIRGHVYAADSVPVKVENIQHLIDSTLISRKLFHMPKVMLLQACQVDEEPSKLATDSPKSQYFLHKSNYIVYWAAAPEFEALRHEVHGSFFIQILCRVIREYSKHQHLYDIFTKVTDLVSHICTRLEHDQTPLFESTLRKKLFLQIPQQIL